MELIILLLIIFLWSLWGRVGDMKKDYEERIENLEFSNQLLKDSIVLLKKKVEKASPARTVSTEKETGEDFSSLSFADESQKGHPSSAEEKPKARPEAGSESLSSAKSQSESETSFETKPEVVSAQKTEEKTPETPAEKTEEKPDKKPDEQPAEGYSWLKSTASLDKPGEEGVSDKDDQRVVAAKVVASKSLDEEPVASGGGRTPPPVPPREPGWNESWQNFIANVDWEQFTGTKLFAWLGGIALFIGAGFFVKYSIDKNLVSPMVRLVIGAILGLFMIGGSFWFERGRYDVMRQTFSAGGIGVLYSVFFAATLYYEYLPKTAGFASLVVVSATAFVLAIFHRGVSISVLGAVGAYLTPLLVNTGQGNIITLYLYLAVVNAGVYQVIRRLESNALLLFSTLGTMTSLALACVFSKPEPDVFHMGWAWVAHLALYTLFFDRLKLDLLRSRSASWAVSLTYLAMPLVAFLIVVFKAGSAPMLMMAGTVTLAVILAWRNRLLHAKVISLSALTYLVVAAWAFFRFTPEIDNWAFLLFFIYGLAGGAGPVLLIHKNGIDPEYLKWLRVFPVGLAFLGLIALIINPEVSFLFWPMTIGLQLIGIAISLVFGAIFQVGMLSLILLISALLFITNSTVLTFNLTFYGFILLAGAAICLVTFFVLRRALEFAENLNLDAETTSNLRTKPALTEWMSASPVMGIFFILAAAFIRSAPLNPHPGMVTMLCFLGVALTLSRRMKFEYLGVLSLFSAAFSQAFWVFRPDLTTELQFASLLWSAAFFVAALILPFVFFKSYQQWKKLWMSWPIFEVAQAIFLIYAADHIWARDYSGWIPLLMALIKIPIVVLILRQLTGKEERNSIVACHGGVLLFYVSAVPILLLEKGWLGLVLVLEATALLWLNRRVEHPGLRWVSTALAPIGLYLLLSYMPQLKGPQSIIILNPAVLATLSAVIALGFAVKFADFPQEHLGRMNLVRYFQWLAFATGFYWVNLVVADVFAGSQVAQGRTLQFIPRNNLLQEIAYTTLWALFGAILWTWKTLPRLLRYIGMFLLCVSTFWLIMFPVMHGAAVAAMAPVFNLGLLAYLPIMAILIFLFLKEPWGDRYLSVKNLFLAMLLVVGFLCIKLVKATIFQAGLPLDLFRERTAEMAVASIAGWLIYGLAMLLWPKRLDKPFRIAGLVLTVLALLRSLIFPFKYAVEFGAMTPLFNRPTALYLFIVALLIWLIARRQDDTWPVPFVMPRHFWGIALALMSFFIMNIEIASFFGEKGRDFSLLTRGSLSHQLGYSLGWLVYAISLLIIGIRLQVVRARQAALLLIIITSFKIFLKDLWSLGQLYRVASFIGLAFIMMLVSYLYQRFLTKMGDK
jgi:hypothetical protein